MSVFNFSKKLKDKEKMTEGTCKCACQSAQSKQSSVEYDELKTSDLSIKVLGSGCKSCHKLFENAQQAAGSSQVEYLTDMQEVMKYGVMSMPALVVNEKVVSAGRVLKAEEIKKLLGK